MPEKPKRRKNNKNKRKNKNNRAELNRTNSDVSDSANSESSSVQIDDKKEDKTSEFVENLDLVNVTQSFLSENITPEIEAISDNVGADDHIFNQDLNNNSNNTPHGETLEVPVLNAGSTKINQEYECIEIQESQSYVVETPDQSVKSKPKLSNAAKSKSLDNDDAPKIIEVTTDTTVPSEDANILDKVDTTNVLVSEVESDVEWEKTDEFSDEIPLLEEAATGVFSITTVPLNVAQCEQTKSLTPEEETSLRNYLKTLNLATHPENMNSVEIKAEIEQIINREIRHRLRKKGLAEDFVTQRLGLPRTLDVIDEEGSSESSMTSRRQSYLNEKNCDDDLEDDVFEDKNKSTEKFSTKAVNTLHKTCFGRLVPQQCLLVGAKIKEPEITEARGDWTMKTIEKMTGAEVVYLTDSSSSTSSLHDFAEEADDGIDTDASVRMITPTIEVTDTESFLKKTFISNNDNEIPNKSINILQLENEEKGHAEHFIKIELEKDSNEQTHNVSSQNSHEIVVLSTDNIKTDLYVKELDETENNLTNKNASEKNIGKVVSENKESDLVITPKKSAEYDLEIKVLKCELNDAFNNLIKEVVSDSETPNDTKDTFTRQDSSSSISSSQCTAKYNPTSSSLNDVSNIMHDETPEHHKSNIENTQTSSVSSHVKDVFECVTGISNQNKYVFDTNKQPYSLRDLCVRKIALFPYGDKILEELASVSKRLHNITAQKPDDKSATNKHIKEKELIDNMPYFSWADLSMEKVTSIKKFNDSNPPPIQPRKSSLKKSHDEEFRTGLVPKTEHDYVSLSPSQKMLMGKTKTTLHKEDSSQVLDYHKNFVDRKDHTECSGKEKVNIEGSMDISSIIPLKSRTGSRLLALIRNPTVTGTVKSVDSYNSLEHLQKTNTISETISKKASGKFNNLSNTFKPIPPPRPKKMTSFYESDENSDYTDNSLRSMKSEKKIFHFSTGNLNKEIENDISSIQNMHRFYTNKRDQLTDYNCPRRPSLPKDLCDQQMEYIRQKEKEVEAEIQRLETIKKNSHPSQKKGPRAPLISEKEIIDEQIKDADSYFISRKRDAVINSRRPENKDEYGKGKISSLFTSSQEELLRDKMYSEYVNQMAERQERKQHKVIKITHSPATTSENFISKSMSALDILDSKVNNRIEKEFICKARERWNKLGIKDPETEDEIDLGKCVYREPKVIDHKIKVIEGGEEQDVKKLPNHLQEFVQFTAKDRELGSERSGESEGGPASPHVVIWCAVIIIVLAVSKYVLRLLRNK